MKPHRNILSNAPASKRYVTWQERARLVAEALRQCTPEQLAQARQLLRERWGLPTPQWELERAGQIPLFDVGRNPQGRAEWLGFE